MEDIKEANQELWKCHTKIGKELNELKEKISKKEPMKELDSSSSGVCV